MKKTILFFFILNFSYHSYSQNFKKDSAYIKDLKFYMKEKLESNIEGVSFNGDVLGKSLYTVLSVNFPATEKSELLLFNLDINNICASGGSACSSGVVAGSHVIAALYNNKLNAITVRFSFSKYNTKEEIDTVIEALKKLI